MDGPFVGVAGFLAVLVLILFGMPVAVAMGLVGALGFGLVNGFAGVAFVLSSAAFEAVFPYSLSVIPMFVAMGVFAARAGLSASLFAAAYASIGRLRGGLVLATIAACAGFGAICGSSLATVATMCRVAWPEMRARGYDPGFAAAAIAAGGTLGVLIPPSILLAIYGLLTEQSIGALFAAALLPGLVATALYMLGAGLALWLRPELAPAGTQVHAGERRQRLREVRSVALLFLLVVGGIYGGVFSPTEAAAVGAFGTAFLAWRRGGLNRFVLADCIGETARVTGMIFFVLVGATIFNYFVETTGLPQRLVGAIEAAAIGPLPAMLAIILFYLLLGCFMDSLSMILLTIPFVFPVVTALGWDPVWFGIMVVTVAEIGLITPPVGMNLFVIQGTAGEVDMATLVRGLPPFLLADLVRILVLLAFPGLCLWLPSLIRI
ncbi:C4-dicarboxylate TRAP transporter large permease protein DctM [bacterium HR40]|nr:C4-dicarboxylate TRAP transporter large permease protein DctM [bacterium HR40]